MMFQKETNLVSLIDLDKKTKAEQAIEILCTVWCLLVITFFLWGFLV